MTLADIRARGARFAYRYGVERELWMANLEKNERAITSTVYTDDGGDPIFFLEPLDPEDFKRRDWSILAENDEQ